MKQEKIILLVQRVQSGDQGAFDELLGLVYNDIYYFALKTVNNEDTAADVTQEALIEIYKNINDLKEAAAFPAWCRQITYFQCTRYFRKKKEVLLDNDDEEEGTIFDTLKEDTAEFIPEELMDKKHFRETVMSFINSLTEEQRSAVMMYYFEELSVGEIAKIQGVSEGTVKSRLNYARKSIKQMVEEYERTTDTKLHAIPFIPFIKWMFSSEKSALSLPFSPEAAAEAAISAASASAASASAAATTAATATTATTAATAATTAATAATAASVGTTVATSAVGASIAAKIAIGAVAMATLIGGTVGVMNYVKDNKDEDDDDLKPKYTYVVPMTDENGDVVVFRPGDITNKPQTEEPEQPVLKEEYEDVIIGNVRYVYDDGVTYSTTDVYDRYASLQGESWEAVPASYTVDTTVTELNILSEINGCPVQVRDRMTGERFGDIYPNLKKVEVDSWYVDLAALDSPELETLVIGSNVIYVENTSDEGLAKLNNIKILPGNQRIGRSVFMYTPFYNDESNWQDDLLIVDGVLLDTNRKSGWNAIYVIPEGVTNVAEDAFEAASGPTPADDIIYIPSTLTKGLEWSDIADCINVYISEDNPVYRIENSCLINYRDKIFLKAGNYQLYHGKTYQYYEEGDSISQITLNLSSDTMIPSDGSVTIIGADAFRNWNAYTDIETLIVVIPNTITKIEEGAFDGANVKIIYAESNPEPEQPVLNEDGIVIIGNVKYEKKQGTSWTASPASENVDPTVTELTILSEINGYPVAEATSNFGEIYPNLKKLEIDYWYITGNFNDCNELETVVIGSNVKFIAASSFSSLPKLKNVTVLPGNQYIYGYVFHDTPFYNDESNWQNGMLIVDDILWDVRLNNKHEYIVPEGVTYAVAGSFSRLIADIDGTVYIPSTLTRGLGASSVLVCSNIQISPDNPVYLMVDSELIDLSDIE